MLLYYFVFHVHVTTIKILSLSLILLNIIPCHNDHTEFIRPENVSFWTKFINDMHVVNTCTLYIGEDLYRQWLLSYPVMCYT